MVDNRVNLPSGMILMYLFPELREGSDGASAKTDPGTLWVASKIIRSAVEQRGDVWSAGSRWPGSTASI